MAGNKEVNSNLEIKGKINLKDVPNNTPTGFLVWNSGIKDIAQRTPAQIISDLGLITATNIAASYYTKTQVDTNIKTAVDNIQIGGRNFYNQNKNLGIHNLKRNPTVIPETFYGFYFVGNTTWNYVRINNVINSKGWWTVSFEIKGSESTNSYIDVDICDTNKTRIRLTPDNEWVRHSVSAFVENDYDFVDFEDGQYAEFFLRNIKIEKGNKATDWTPAPEDQVSDWNTTDANSFSFIKNKPIDDISKGVQAFGWGNHAGLYAPINHSHTFASITYKPATIAGYGITDAMKINSIGGLNNLSGTGSTYVPASNNSIWFDYNWADTGMAGSVINFSGLSGAYAIEIFSNYSDGSYLVFRTRNGDNNNWNPARQIWHTGNFTPSDYVTLNTNQTISGTKTFSGTLNADSFKKIGGTSTQILMADGSVKDQSTVGGSNYTAGSNISISGNTISVVSSPTFSGSVTAPAFYESSLKSLKKISRLLKNQG